ncbi:MAG: hypothetical protein K1X39_13310 [Thermoflexales bacterium]|nr:hypothetical protein [Thermoflexales bacterium]
MTDLTPTVDLPPGCLAWLATHLDRPESPACVHARPWSTVWRLAHAGGTAWLKIPGPGYEHEPALTAALARWRPADVAQVRGLDARRGWLLLDDAGNTLRAQTPDIAALDAWPAILARYAELQIALLPHVAEMAALGVPDRHATGLAAQIDAVLDDEAALMLDQPDGLTAALRDSLRARLPRLRALAARLADAGLPETLANEDFHDANIFIRDGHPRFLDWGEGGVTHPFVSLLVLQRSLAYRLGLTAGSPALTRIIDAYLQPWTRFAPLPVLRDQLAPAGVLGRACRALTWHRALAPHGDAVPADDRSAVPGWLELLNEALE